MIRRKLSEHGLAYGFVTIEALALIVLTVILVIKNIVAEPQEVMQGELYSQRQEIPSRVDTAVEEAAVDELLAAVDTEVVDIEDQDGNIFGIRDDQPLVPLGDVSVEVVALDPYFLALQEEVSEKLASMSLEEKVAQVFLVSPETLTVTPNVIIAGSVTRNSIWEYPVGGIVYSYKNYNDDMQATNLLRGVNNMSNERIGLDMWLFATDGNSVFKGSSSNYDMLVNVLSGINTTGLMDTEELIKVRVVPADEVDTDMECLILSAATNEGLFGTSTAAFVSEEAVDYVRCDLEYDNVIISDAVTVAKIPQGMNHSETAIEALNAGVDMVYMPTDFREVYMNLLEAVLDGSVSVERLDDAVSHILMQKLTVTED